MNSNSNNLRWRYCSFVLMMACIFAGHQSATAFTPQESDGQAENGQAEKKDAPEMLSCNVLVLDPDGQPVADAVVYCTGLRSPTNPGSHYFWSDESFGPPPKLKTNSRGLVEMPYPKFITKDIDVGTMTWSVEHPDFVPFRGDFSVTLDPAEIKLVRGYRLAATAIDATTGEAIKNDLYGFASGGSNPKDWKLTENGMLVSPVFAQTQNRVRLVQLKPDSPALFSELLELDPGNGGRLLKKNIPLHAGARIEGKLDDSVPRPVKNGFVIVTIGNQPPGELARERTWFWSDMVDINEDGTFVVESIPKDEIVQLLPLCDGWVPAKLEAKDILPFYPRDARKADGNFSLPQLFRTKDDVIAPTLKMAQAGDLKVTVLDSAKQPIAGAMVGLSPNQYSFNRGSTILGEGGSLQQMRDYLAGAEIVPPMFGSRYRGTTDDQGVLVIKSIPIQENSCGVYAKGYEPIDDGGSKIPIKLEAGKRIEVTVTLQKTSSAESPDAMTNKPDTGNAQGDKD